MCERALRLPLTEALSVIVLPTGTVRPTGWRTNVGVTSGNNVTLVDANGLNLTNVTVSGNLAVTAGGAVDFVGNGASTVLGGMTLTGAGMPATPSFLRMMYQSIRRCWRFGQTKPVTVHLMVAEGEDQIGRVIARKVLKGLGLDQVTLAGSGSAPIPAELIVWYRRLGLKLMEGYAMTEDSSFSHTSSDAHNAPGYVGVPLPGVQVRISDTGEILIKSPGQFSGYYKQPELTAGCFTPDGYFRTGDLAELDEDGAA